MNYLFLFLSLFLLNFANAQESLVRYKEAPKIIESEKEYQTTYVPDYIYEGLETPLEDLQCPIPHENRVKNYTGIQCVYSSIEALGRWAEEPKLTSPPITSRSDCKGFSGPSRAAEILNKLNVKFEQSYGDKEKGIRLLKKAMMEGRGALWDVPGHAMVLVHYNEQEDKVCWFDNSDKSLKIQQTTVEKFNKRWGSWILVIYADNDIVSEKVHKFNLPIFDVLNPSRKYEKGYVPFPQLTF